MANYSHTNRQLQIIRNSAQGMNSSFVISKKGNGKDKNLTQVLFELGKGGQPLGQALVPTHELYSF